MSGFTEIDTPAGRLRHTEVTQVIYDEPEAAAEYRQGQPWLTRDGKPTNWTLDGRPVTEARARAIIGRMRAKAAQGDGASARQREADAEAAWAGSDQGLAAVGAAWERWVQVRRAAPDAALPGIIFVDQADVRAVVYAAFRATGREQR